MAVIQLGEYVALRDLDGQVRVFHVAAENNEFRFGKYPDLPASVLLGKPYGATLRYAIENSQWIRCKRITPGEDDSDDGEATVPQETNKDLAQNNTAQSMSPEEIHRLKDTTSSVDVVAAVAASSTTFEGKTKFSQKKYLARKLRKHVQQVVILRPTPALLSEAYMKSAPQKICSLRFDYLSALLYHADVHAGGRYLVIDAGIGLVAGSVAYRLAGQGRVFRAFTRGPSEKAIEELNLDSATRGVVSNVPIDVLNCEDPDQHAWLQFTPRSETAENPMSPEEKQRQENRALKVEQRREVIADLRKGSLDAVIAVGADSTVAASLGASFLRPGGILSSYSPHFQPLVKVQGSMKTGDVWLAARIQELFTREHQVLPMRTHPHMQISNLCEGFLLTATKLSTAPSPPTHSKEPEKGSEAVDEPETKKQKTC